MLTFKRAAIALAAVLAIALSGSTASADGIPLGIAVIDTPRGIEVTEVYPGGIADRCMPRLRPGAYIVTLNGLPVKSAADFQRTLGANTYVKFDFVDLKGEFRWAHAWSGPPSCCVPAVPGPNAPIPLLPPPMPMPLNR